MGKRKKININQQIIDAWPRVIERAVETSIRTQTPLVVMKDGKLTEVMPPYKYILVPTKPAKRKK